MDTICNIEKCTGCSACLNCCHKDAIEMVADTFGFLYPKIDKSQCSDCELCRKICPVNSPIPKTYPLETYAAYSIDTEDRLTSTSGGAASVFSSFVLSQNGVVYGCSGENIEHVKHVRIDKSMELNQLKSSKYVQSEMGFILRKVKFDLNAGFLTLFIGTPCQVAGIKSFLGKEYSNLITVDLVCHGVPSQKLLNDGIEKYKKRTDFTNISFRRKDLKGKSHKYGIYFYQDNRTVLAIDYPDDNYILGFNNALFLRTSCCLCQHACPERCSDITIGDFWGLGKYGDTSITEKHLGVTEVLINTNKGHDFVKSCKSKLFLEKRPTKEAVEGNGQLIRPSKKHENNDLFKKLYIEKGFDGACNICLKDDKKAIRKQQRNQIIKKIPLVYNFYKFVKKK